MHIYSNESVASLDAIPGHLLRTSAASDWRSLLVGLHRSDPDRSSVETLPTPDLTLGVALSGHHRLDVFEKGFWRACDYRAGASGLTAPGETDRLRWDSTQPFEIAHLFLPRTLIAETAEELRRGGQRVPADPLSAFVLHDPVVSSTVFGLLRALRSGYGGLYADQAARWLATHLLVAYGGVDPAPGVARGYRSIDKRMSRAVALINESYGEPLTLDLLASEAGVSKFHFARLFRDRTGQSPHAYLTERRMIVARRLLKDTDLPISTVAEEAGYVRPVQFAAAFRRAHGMTPTGYRSARDA